MKAKQPPVECCAEWMGIAPSQRGLWPFQVIHRFSHSRTTFSVRTFAAIAVLDEPDAAQMIADAELRQWVWTPQAGVWVGRLSRRR
jgi:hypothetical protein